MSDAMSMSDAAPKRRTGHGEPQRRCVGSGLRPCKKRVTARGSRPFPMDKTKRWCGACRIAWWERQNRCSSSLASLQTAALDGVSSDVEKLFATGSGDAHGDEMVDESFEGMPGNDFTDASSVDLPSRDFDQPMLSVEPYASTAMTASIDVAAATTPSVDTIPTLSTAPSPPPVINVVPPAGGMKQSSPKQKTSRSSNTSPAVDGESAVSMADAASSPVDVATLVERAGSSGSRPPMRQMSLRRFSTRPLSAGCLANYRWSILRQDAVLKPLVERWWQRCLSSLKALEGVNWTALKVDPEDGGLPAYQRDVHTVASAYALQMETTRVLQQLLVDMGVPRAKDKDCCVMKLLRSPPGAGRQALHWDIKQDEPLHDKNRQAIKGSKKASECLSIIIHLNPCTMKGTYVPNVTAKELDRRLDTGTTANCQSIEFVSNDMEQGDALVFYQDVPHYGPEFPVDASLEVGKVNINSWRWVLFVMFSPESTAGQDEIQDLLICK
jgi:hypothetical protein